MSSGALNAAKAVRGITGPQKCVLLLLADHANGENVAWPSKKTLSEESCLSVRCVQESLLALEKAGLIQRTSTWRKDGSRSSDEITLTLPTPPCATRTPPMQVSVAPPAPRAPLEPRLNQEDEHKNTRERAGALFEDLDPSQPQTVPLPPGPTFEDFWRAYPSKVGKGAAAKVWLKALAKITSDEILRAVEAQKTTDRWLKGYVPNPATWLNQERWADEVTGQAPGLGGLPDW